MRTLKTVLSIACVLIAVSQAVLADDSRAATKKYRMELYLQAFNLMNHTNLGVFNGVETSPYFAQATSAQGPRRLEAGLRFNF